MSRSQDVGHAREPEVLHQVLEEPVDVDHPPEVDLPGTHRGHLPVQDGHRLEVHEHHVAHPGVTPAEHGVVLVARPVLLQPLEAPLDEGRADPVGGHPVVVAPHLVHVVPEGTGPVVRTGQEGGRSVDGQGVEGGEGLDGGALQPLLVGQLGLEEPVVAEGVGQDVGGHDPLDPLHDEERHPDDVGAVLQPQHGGDGHVGVFGHHLHGQELTLHVVGLEHGVGGRVRGDAGHQGPGLRALRARPGRRGPSRRTCRSTRAR